MFDLEEAMTKWRARMVERSLTIDQVEEIEEHLRASIDELSTSDLTPEEQFLIATHRLGNPGELGAEYAKVTPFQTWRVPIFWATVGVAWVIGVLAIFDVASSVGLWTAARLGLHVTWMESWVAFVCAVGPVITFASVGAWMRRYSAAHAASRRALFITVAVAALVRLGSIPLLKHSDYWSPLDPATRRAISAAWSNSLIVGFLFSVAVGAFVLVRYSGVSIERVERR